jgi:hypothetical protein
MGKGQISALPLPNLHTSYGIQGKSGIESKTIDFTESPIVMFSAAGGMLKNQQFRLNLTTKRN